MTGNLERFSGFADLYDSVRPAPPAVLGPILCAYALVDRPAVVDLGSGSGLSSRCSRSRRSTGWNPGRRWPRWRASCARAG